jgi:hypothetical protein
MEAALTSETSVDNYFTRHYIPEDIWKSIWLHDSTSQKTNLKIYLTTRQHIPEDKSENLFDYTAAHPRRQIWKSIWLHGSTSQKTNLKIYLTTRQHIPEDKSEILFDYTAVHHRRLWTSRVPRRLSVSWTWWTETKFSQHISLTFVSVLSFLPLS